MSEAMRRDRIMVTIVRSEGEEDPDYPTWLCEDLRTNYAVWCEAELLDSVALVPADGAPAHRVAADALGRAASIEVDRKHLADWIDTHEPGYHVDRSKDGLWSVDT